MEIVLQQEIALERVPGVEVVTPPKFATEWRKSALKAASIGVPIGVGILAALRGERSIGRGILAGAGAALALGALRWQMARWFTAAPAYTVLGRVGEIELRAYPDLVEARTEVDAQQFEDALDAGFGRLACYVFGANGHHTDLPMAAPVLTEMHAGRYLMTFVMPPGRALGTLPTPDDPRIELRVTPARQIAVLAFRGRFTADNVGAHERTLLGSVVDAGLVGRGSVVFAGYDGPSTLPFLRRNELWLEVV